MQFKCFKVVETTIAKLATWMIEYDFSSLADVSLFEMHLQLAVGV